MKVSVIVPVYNHAKYLRMRLDSILSQTYKDYELIILDDASIDNSREIIEEYARKIPGMITCYNDHNSGSPFKQWNKGVGMASGEFIWIAESDDYADDHFLEKTIHEITKSELIGIVFTDTWVIDEEKHIKYRFSDRKKNNSCVVKRLTIKSIVNNPIPNASSIIFRRDVYLDAGHADELMKFSADWFLAIKIARLKEVIYIPEALSTYRLHKNSTYHQHLLSNQILNEKWKIGMFLIKYSDFSIHLYLIIAKFMIKVLLLRIMKIVNFPSLLMPEIPRRPRNIYTDQF